MLEFIAYWQPLPLLAAMLLALWLCIQYPIWRDEHVTPITVTRAKRAVYAFRRSGFPVPPPRSFIPWWFWIVAPFGAAEARRRYRRAVAELLAEYQRDVARSNYHRLISDHHHLKENQ